MKYIELFAEIAAGITGGAKDAILKKMLEYEQNIESEGLLYQEVAPETAEKLRLAGKTDPAGFLRSAGKGLSELLKKPLNA